MQVCFDLDKLGMKGGRESVTAQLNSLQLFPNLMALFFIGMLQVLDDGLALFKGRGA